MGGQPVYSIIKHGKIKRRIVCRSERLGREREGGRGGGGGGGGVKRGEGMSE